MWLRGEAASSLAEAPLKVCLGSSSANQVAKNTTTAKLKYLHRKLNFLLHPPLPLKWVKSRPEKPPDQPHRRHRPLWIVESFCGLRLRCFVQNVPTPGRQSHKCRQVACCVPWLSLCLEDQVSPNPLHLSQEGSCIGPQKLPTNPSCIFSFANNLLLCWPGLLGSASPPPRSRLDPANPPTHPAPSLIWPFQSSSAYICL